MNELQDLLQPTFLGNTLGQWALAGASAFAVLIVLLSARRIVRAQLGKLAGAPQHRLLELPLTVASRTTVAFIVLVALYVGLHALSLPSRASTLAATLFTIGAFWQAGLWATTAAIVFLEQRAERALSLDRAALGTLGIIRFIARLTIWSLVLLLTLANLGVQIGPLLAGLGIGGIAVALATQSVLGDLFASLAITLDRPFVVGDAIAVDDFSGTVEYIGVKSTRLRSVTGEQIVIPNANLMNSRMRNHSRLRERRVVLTLSVGPDTSADKLRRIPELMRSQIEVHPQVRFDRAHLTKIAPNAFDFEAVYHVKLPDPHLHMDIQQAVILGLLEALEREGVVLAGRTRPVAAVGSRA